MLANVVKTGCTHHLAPAMPARAAEVLRKCFQDKPEDRWITMLEVAETLRVVYRYVAGREYAREAPGFQKRVEVVARDRWLKEVATWEDPFVRLVTVLTIAGGDANPKDAEAPIFHRSSTHAGQAATDLDTYERILRLLEKLIALGRNDLEEYLAGVHTDKARIHEYCADYIGELDEYDKTIKILERLAREERRQEFAGHLAERYNDKGQALWLLGDLREAVSSYEEAIEILERLVDEEERHEFADHLAESYNDKGQALRHLGDPHEALSFHEKAIEICERLVHEEGREELRMSMITAQTDKTCVLLSLREYSRGGKKAGS